MTSDSSKEGLAVFHLHDPSPMAVQRYKSLIERNSSGQNCVTPFYLHATSTWAKVGAWGRKRGLSRSASPQLLCCHGWWQLGPLKWCPLASSSSGLGHIHNICWPPAPTLQLALVVPWWLKLTGKPSRQPSSQTLTSSTQCKILEEFVLQHANELPRPNSAGILTLSSDVASSIHSPDRMAAVHCGSSTYWPWVLLSSLTMSSVCPYVCNGWWSIGTFLFLMPLHIVFPEPQ